MNTNPNSQSDFPEPPSSQRPYYQNEVDLRELFMVLWKGRFWIIYTTLTAAVITVAIALWLPNIYRSEALLAVDEDGSGGLADLAAQYGGLASLAGISLPASGSSDKAVAIETLKSLQFISEFIEQRDILAELMASTSYDLASGEISYKKKIYDIESDVWTRKAKLPYVPKPSYQEAYEEFMEIMFISEDQETGFVTLAIEHISPRIAERWVTWLIEDVNRKMLTEDRAEAQQAIDYLTDQLQQTQVVALEEVFYSLIEEQTKTIMLASARPEYIFKTIDQAAIMEEKASPQRALICILGVILGGIFGTLLVLLKGYFFKFALE